MEKSVGITFMVAFLAVIIGLAFFGITAQQVNVLTEQGNNTGLKNHTFNPVDATWSKAVSTDSEARVYLVEVLNASYDQMNASSSNITYRYTAGVGTVPYVWINIEGNNTGDEIEYYTYYKFYSEGYIQNTGANNVTKLIMVMFALLVLAIGIAYAWKNLPEI